MPTPDAGQELLTGPGRLETWGVIGRVIRQGTPAELHVSDADCFYREVVENRPESAQAYLEYIDRQWLYKLACVTEWVLGWGAFLGRQVGRSAAEAVLAEACAAWQGLRAWSEDDAQRAAFATVAEVLTPESILGNPPENFAELNRRICAVPAGIAGELRARFAAGRREEMAADFGRYHVQYRVRHDLLFGLIWAITSAADRAHGQELAERGLCDSLTECSFNRRIVGALLAMSPTARAAMLAENMRTHFSGRKRDGQNQIIEEPDCFRVLCAPCGSGGALRQALAACPVAGFDRFRRPTAATWGLADTVPAYCAHCAQNEIRSLALVGYPLVVTEFSTDLARPCGWKLYKSPELIPAEYFERVGGHKPRQFPTT